MLHVLNVSSESLLKVLEKMAEGSENFLDKSKKALKDIKSSLKDSLGKQWDNKVYASFAYVPILGPLVIFLYKRSQKLSMLHAKNAAYLQLAFCSIWLVIWLLENIPVFSHLLKLIQFIPFVTNALMYMFSILFILLSAYGALQGFREKTWLTPYLYQFFDKYLSRYAFKKDKGRQKTGNKT